MKPKDESHRHWKAKGNIIQHKIGTIIVDTYIHNGHIKAEQLVELLNKAHEFGIQDEFSASCKRQGQLLEKFGI